MKKMLSLSFLILTSLIFVACGSNNVEDNNVVDADIATEDTVDRLDLSDFYVAMLTDSGGVNDQSFNQSAWEGLERFREDTSANVNYLESRQAATVSQDLDRLLDMDNDIIWAIGFLMGDPLLEAALMNPDQMYGIIDFTYGEDTPDNVVSVMFKDYESSFLVGYMAGMSTETGKVGFVGGMPGEVIHRFEIGFRAGVAYASFEKNEEIEVLVQYADSFSDDARGRAIATSMITDGADIIFHAAGNVGQGVIEAARSMNVRAIGVDRDQSDLAPDTVMTSALKLVGDAMYDVSKRIAMGENLGGQTLYYGIAEGGVGIPPFEGSTAELVDENIFNDTMDIKERIRIGDILVPTTFEELESFINNLQ